MSLLPLLHGFGVILGLFLLIKGSDWFVEGAASIALKRGVSQHLIGFTLVAFATSLPELATAVASRAAGEAELAVGNILGSNVANIGLVLGLAALFLPIKSNREVRRDAVFMLFSTLLLAFFFYFRKSFGVIMGITFLSIYALYLRYLGKSLLKENNREELPRGAISIKKEVVLLILGFILLTIGAEILVRYAVGLAEDFGVSTGVIGLSIVAIGTSFPELATSITAAIKKNEGIAIGNVLGSNTINLLLILGLLGTTYGFSGMGVEAYVTATILPLLLVITVLEFGFSFRTQGRPQGVVLLLLYALFLYVIIF